MALGPVLLLTLTTLGALSGSPPPVWPVAHPQVLSAFRPPSQPWGAGHRGVDLAARTDEPIRAMQAGVVGFAGTVAGKQVVTIVLADGRRLTYEPLVASVAPGRRVEAGDVIGRLADSGGHCGGRAGCLHVGLLSGTAYVDPLTLMDRRPAVLKPWRSRDRQPRADVPA